MSLTQVNNQFYYGPNNRFRALDSLGGLTNTFKQRFKQGIVTQLPPTFHTILLHEGSIKILLRLGRGLATLTTLMVFYNQHHYTTMILARLILEQSYNVILHLISNVFKDPQKLLEKPLYKVSQV